MKKTLVPALILLALAFVVLLFNRGRVEVNLLIGTVEGLKALVFLGFMATGVAIGVLLK